MDQSCSCLDYGQGLDTFVFSLAWSPTHGNILACTCGQGDESSVSLWDVATGRRTVTLSKEVRMPVQAHVQGATDPCVAQIVVLMDTGSFRTTRWGPGNPIRRAHALHARERNMHTHDSSCAQVHALTCAPVRNAHACARAGAASCACKCAQEPARLQG